MASAKHGYAEVATLFARELAALDPSAQPARDAAWRTLTSRLDDALLATVEDVVRLTPTIVEVIVKAPAAARHFQPGQFYRLQNFESPRRAPAATPLLMEGIALTGAWVDKERGLLSLIALELGVSSRLVAYLRKGEPVVVMGPTGAPTEIPEGQTVLLLGGGLGNAVLFSIAKALRDNGNKVIYFAGYKKRRGSVQARRDRSGDRSGDLVHRHGRADRAAPPAGRALPRQHRAVDARVSRRRARPSRSCRCPRSTASSPSAPTA